MLCGLYACLVIGVLILLRWFGDTWWPGIFVLYGPRWVWAVPLLGLVPAAILGNRRCLPTLAATVLLLIGPIMGLQLPLRFGGVAGGGEARTWLRILTCNVHYRNLNQRAFRTLIEDTTPDIIVVQEWSPGNYDAETLAPGPGWHVQVASEFAIASRFPIVTIETCRTRSPTSRPAAVRYGLQTPEGVVDIVSVHPASVSAGIWEVRVRGREGLDSLDANSRERWRDSLAIARSAPQTVHPLLVAGDFNAPPEGPLFQQCWANYQDGFATAGFGFGLTWYGHWWHGLRIDHILADPRCWTIQRCWVGPDVGSDHQPLLADLELRWRED